jgi:cytochrome c553
MRRVLAVLTLGTAGLAGAAHAAAQQQSAASAAPAAPPAAITWAYPLNPAAGGGGGGGAAAQPDPTKLTLPGATTSFTRAEIGGGTPADWRPDTHPTMPNVVASGRAPDVRACALCHYPNGQGRPENGPVSGLNRDYIVRQLEDFKSGARKSSEPRLGPVANMVRIAKAMTPEEIQIAADYFSSFPYRKWVRVVEQSTAPKVRFAGGMFMGAEGTEPVGARVVEIPEDSARTLLRDPISGFVAFVAPGTLARGKTLVETGGGKVTACAVCHGADLKGIGPVPAIAGRTVSYLTRQLYDFKSGARAGPWAGLMQPVVDKLSEAEMTAVAAYASSLNP